VTKVSNDGLSSVVGSAELLPIEIVYLVLLPVTSQVDSAFHLPWDGKMSTSQRAVMLCGWEGNTGLAESNGSLPPGG